MNVCSTSAFDMLSRSAFDSFEFVIIVSSNNLDFETFLSGWVKVNIINIYYVENVEYGLGEKISRQSMFRMWHALFSNYQVWWDTADTIIPSSFFFHQQSTHINTNISLINN